MAEEEAPLKPRGMYLLCLKTSVRARGPLSFTGSGVERQREGHLLCGSKAFVKDKTGRHFERNWKEVIQWLA